VRHAPRSPLRFILPLLAALKSSAAFAFPACPPAEGEMAQSETAKVVAIDERFELLLERGQRVRVWGIEAPPHDGNGAAGRERLLAWLTAHPVTLRLLAPAADRWGRIEAHVYAARPDLPPLSVAEALVEAGLARVRPEAEDADCLQRLRGLEAYALKQGLGLWAHARLRPLPAADRQAFAGRAGEQVIVQGRVESVSATGYATYLNFGPIRTADFSIAIRSRVRPQIEAAMGPLDDLRGRLVEVRGLLDNRFGPQIEINGPHELQRLDEGMSGSPYSGRETRR
jgi:endonuclease YncB( thermonuclease family)